MISVYLKSCIVMISSDRNYFDAYCQNGEIPVGFWKCEDLQADGNDDDGVDEDDEWSVLTGVGYIESRHVACHISLIWPSAFLHFFLLLRT